MAKKTPAALEPGCKQQHAALAAMFGLNLLCRSVSTQMSNTYGNVEGHTLSCLHSCLARHPLAISVAIGLLGYLFWLQSFSVVNNLTFLPRAFTLLDLAVDLIPC